VHTRLWDSLGPLQSSLRTAQFSRFCMADVAFYLYVSLRRTIPLSQKIAYFCEGMWTLIHYSTHHPKRHLDRVSRFSTIHARKAGIPRDRHRHGLCLENFTHLHMNFNDH